MLVLQESFKIFHRFAFFTELWQLIFEVIVNFFANIADFRDLTQISDRKNTKPKLDNSDN